MDPLMSSQLWLGIIYQRLHLSGCGKNYSLVCILLAHLLKFWDRELTFWKPGSFNIIEDVMKMQGIKYAYYYFDIKDPSKRNLRGLLTSLLLQLSDHSDGSSSLSNLHTLYRDGSELLDNVSLAGCLKEMPKPPGLGEVQIPTFLILDTLDECPNFPGAPPARKEVLEFLQNLVRSAQPHSNLSISLSASPVDQSKIYCLCSAL